MALSDLKMYRSPLLDLSCHRVGDRMSESSGPGARVARHLSHSSGTLGFLPDLEWFRGFGGWDHSRYPVASLLESVMFLCGVRTVTLETKPRFRVRW